jgi:hypothetical protein
VGVDPLRPERGRAVALRPAPEGLQLPLPDGPAAERIAQPRRPLPTPALVEHPVDGVVALGAEVPGSPGLAAACRILSERLADDLRHRRGLSYAIGLDLVAVDADRRFVAVRVDCRDGQEARAARALWRGLVRLAADGPTTAEQAHDREALEEHLTDPRAVVAERTAAGALVTGEQHRTAQHLLEAAGAVSVDHVRTAATAIRDGALLGVPAGVEPSLPDVAAPSSSASDEVAGQVHARRRGSDVPPGARLVVGDDGVSLDLGGGPVTVRYAGALGLLELAPGEWTLVGAHGLSLTVS